MPQSKETLRKRGTMLMAIAKKYRASHLGTKWTQCVAAAGKIYKNKKG
jgi:hypothetical protein